VTLTVYRCPSCGRLLFKSDAPAGTVQTNCPQCKRVRSVEVKPTPVPRR